MSFLAIDIGNTRLKWAVYPDRAAPGSQPLQHGAVFLENIDRLADDDWQGLPPPARILGSNVAGDAVRRRVEEQMEHWDLAPRWVVPSADDGHPAVGARAHALRRGFDGPVLTVMIGTAVTVDALSSDAQFLGGLILPGHGIMLRALEGGTAGLRVPTGEVRDFPTNTSDALTTGGTFAITGAIERMHRLLRQREGREPLVLMTGGAGWKVAPALDVPHELVEGLIFDGLLAIDAARG
jgi:type III pantothenate kinase